MIDELQQLVLELIEDDVDCVALAKTLVSVDRYLLLGRLMTEQVLEVMFEQLEDFWCECSDAHLRRTGMDAAMRGLHRAR
jgi:hypothetical protein